MRHPILKKLFAMIVRVGIVLLILTATASARNFLYATREMLYGPADFVGRDRVIYGDLEEFFYTNPMGMFWENFRLLAVVEGICIFVGAAIGFIVHRARLLPKVKPVDKVLLAVLGCSLAALGICGGASFAAERTNCTFFRMAEACRTVGDYEKLLGSPVYRKIVSAEDAARIGELACFLKSGFVPGRELRIFRARRPEVYILIWLDGDKVAAVNWCHQSAAKRKIAVR